MYFRTESITYAKNKIYIYKILDLMIFMRNLALFSECVKNFPLSKRTGISNLCQKS